MSRPPVIDFEVQKSTCGEWIVRLKLTLEQIKDLSIGLVLLQEGLTDRVIFVSRSEPKKLTIRMNDDTSAVRGQVAVSPQHVQFSISEEERKFWMHFLLRYIREGIGDVDHIDAELSTEGSKVATHVIVSVPLAKPSVSADEARRRLGL